MPVKAIVMSIGDTSLRAKLLGESDLEVEVSLEELFFRPGAIETHPALVRSGDELVRVGDVIALEELDGGRWSRRAALRSEARALQPGTRVLGHITGFRGDTALLMLQSGVPARARLAPVADYLDEHLGPRPDARDLPGRGWLHVGDPVVAFTGEVASDGMLDVDIAGHLESVADGRVERERLHTEALQRQAPEQEAPPFVPADRSQPAECPVGLERVLVIEDDREWAEEALRPWLETRDTVVECLLKPTQWAQAADEVARFQPDLVIVDVYLEWEEQGRDDGREIAKRIREVSPTTPIVVVTGLALDDDRTAGALPAGCEGLVEKHRGMAELAHAIEVALGRSTYDESQGGEEDLIQKASSSRRDPCRTLDHCRRLVHDFAPLVPAQALAVLVYDYEHDRVALEFASCDDLAGPAHEYRAHLQKSPVRDLAFLSDDVPRVTYPLPPDGQQRRSWFWLTKLCHFAAADGLRLRTPDRRAWTLFAFYDDEEQAREARAKGLFGTLALSLEDALWHPHYERHANATRGVLERGERVRELGHELKHALKDVDAVVGTHVESLQSSSLGQVNPTGALEDTRARLEKLHHLTERFLGRPEGRSEAVPLQPLLRRCWLPYSPPDSPWCRAPYIRVHVPVVEPASLMVKGDPDLIEAVVDNLVRNAVDAVEKTRALRVGAADGLTGEISIEAIVDDASAERACIYVHDTGLGISRYVGAHMVRRDFSTTGGTGLGMSIGYSSAAATKGLLNIEETGMYVGTTFALRLPIAQ